MMPILEPAQFPAIFFNGILITVITGIPAALFALAIFFMLERVPFRRVRLLLPVAGAVLMVVVTILSSHAGPPLPEDYERSWVQMMLTGFLTDAFVILAPFPFVRKYTGAYSPYLVIPCTLVVTFFVLVAFGFMGGDAQIAPDTRYALTVQIVYFAVAEFVIAALVYCGIGWLGKQSGKSGE
jgi:hypothetical protein